MKKRILAVEDERDILEVLEFILRDSGYEIETSLTGKDIFDKIEEFHPDLILLDIMIFDRDGREICRQLKADERTQAIPVVIVSAHPEIEETIQDRIGANDYLPKPFDIDSLLGKIERQLAA